MRRLCGAGHGRLRIRPRHRLRRRPPFAPVQPRRPGCRAPLEAVGRCFNGGRHGGRSVAQLGVLSRHGGEQLAGGVHVAAASASRGPTTTVFDSGTVPMAKTELPSRPRDPRRCPGVKRQNSGAYQAARRRHRRPAFLASSPCRPRKVRSSPPRKHASWLGRRAARSPARVALGAGRLLRLVTEGTKGDRAHRDRRGRACTTGPSPSAARASRSCPRCSTIRA